jgi:leukotriene-A4 hydrolase
MLEKKVGREDFDIFLKNYFKENAFKVMTTEAFIEYLEKNMIEKHDLSRNELQYNQWIFGEGLPGNAIEVTSQRFQAVDEALNKYTSGASPHELYIQDWSSHEWLHFLRGLPNQMTNEQMNQLDGAFGFTQTGNSEMLAVWLQHSIRNNYEPAYKRMEEFLVQTGRRKFLVPLYNELVKTEQGKELALKIYEKARNNYHFVAVNTIDGILLR